MLEIGLFSQVLLRDGTGVRLACEHVWPGGTDHLPVHRSSKARPGSWTSSARSV